MVKRIIEILLCFLMIPTINSITLAENSDYNSAEFQSISNNSNLLCEDNFDEFVSGVPSGFISQCTPKNEANSFLSSALGKEGNAVKMTNGNSIYELIKVLPDKSVNVLNVKYSVMLEDKKSEKSVFVRNAEIGEMPLFSFVGDTVKIGGQSIKTDFKYEINKWYDVDIFYNLKTGYVRAYIDSNMVESNIRANVGKLARVYFVSFNAPSGTSVINIDNFRVYGQSELTKPLEDTSIENFNDFSSENTCGFTINNHSPTDKADVYTVDDEFGKCLCLKTASLNMLELLRYVPYGGATFNLKFKMKVSDKAVNRDFALRGYYSKEDGGAYSGEIPFMQFTSEGQIVFSGVNKTYYYSLNKWYDFDITVDLRTKAFNIKYSVDNDKSEVNAYVSNAPATLSCLYCIIYPGASECESKIYFDNFSILSDNLKNSFPKNNSEGVSKNTRSATLNFFSDIAEKGTVLLNGSEKGISSSALGSELTVSLPVLKPHSEYVLSYFGVKTSGGYENGEIRFKTGTDIDIVESGFKEGDKTSYFVRAKSDSGEDATLVMSGYDPNNTNKLLFVKNEKISLSPYEKEYEISYELPYDRSLVKGFVLENNLLPSSKSIKYKEVYNPSGKYIVEKLNLNDVHPRILTNSENICRVKENIKNNSYLKTQYDMLTDNANELLYTPVTPYNIEDGIRLLSAARRIENIVLTLGVAYSLTKNEAYADRLLSELSNAASYKDWNPYHFLDTATIMSAFAIGYDLAYDYISNDENRKNVVVSAIQNKGFEPLLDDYLDRPRNRTYLWTKSDKADNWNVVCNGSAIISALAFSKELPSYSEIIFDNAFESLNKATKEFAPDGAWFEGVMYWQYTIQFYTEILASLNNSLGTDYGLSDIKGFKKTGYFPYSMTGSAGLFSYADSNDEKINPIENFYLSSITKNKSLANIQYSYMLQNNFNLGPKGVLWFNADSDELANCNVEEYFKGAEVCSLRNDKVYVGFLGGETGLAHGHLDKGSFIIDMDGERFAMDLGADSYDIAQSQAFELYRMRAEGHNTLVINPSNGSDQIVNSKSNIIRYEKDSDKTISVMDLTNAYKNDVRSAVRGIKLLKDKSVINIQDEISLLKSGEVWWFMHTNASISISNNGKTAVLSKNGKKMKLVLLSDEGTFEEMNASPLPTSPQNQYQQTNQGIKKLAIHYQNVKDITISVAISPENTDVHNCIDKISMW